MAKHHMSHGGCVSHGGDGMHHSQHSVDGHAKGGKVHHGEHHKVHESYHHSSDNTVEEAMEHHARGGKVHHHK